MKASEAIRALLQARFSAENCKMSTRTNGIPNDQWGIAEFVNEHTRPPNKNIMRDIVGSVVYKNNHGLGMFWKEYL